MAGDVKSAMLDYPGAEQYYRKAMKRNSDAGLAVKIAQTFVHRDRLDKAEAELNRWIEAHGADAQSLLLLGIVHQRQAKLDKAEKIYSQVIEADANNAVALNNLAGIYDIRNDPRALATAERAYRSNPDAADIQDTYGWLLSRYGNPTEGKRLLEKALEQLPGNPEVRFHLAVATLNSGEDRAAKRLLEQLLKEETDFVGKEQAIEIYNKIN